MIHLMSNEWRQACQKRARLMRFFTALFGSTVAKAVEVLAIGESHILPDKTWQERFIIQNQVLEQYASTVVEDNREFLEARDAASWMESLPPPGVDTTYEF